MKKNLLLIVTLFFAVAVSAQKYDYALDRIEATDGLNTMKFYYNNDYLVEAYDIVTPNPWDNLPMEMIDSLTYDERGNILRSDVHQKIDGNWVHVYYLEYTYDNNNNRISRTNYNNFGGEFDIQGIFTYTFDENNRLVYHEMVLVDELFERGNYFYDENGNRTEEIVELTFGNNIWENSSRITYEYDENNNLTNTDYYYWMYTDWAFKEKIANSYDAVGNCATQLFYDGSLLISRLIYTYDMDTDIENVAMPVHPEPLYRNFDQYKNRPFSYSVEMADNNSELVYICDYDFIYKKTDATSANTIPFAAEVRVFPNPASESITVTQPGLKTVEIMDMRGVSVSRYQANSNSMQIDISNLAPGIYFVRSFNGQLPQTSKIIVK